MGNQGIQKIVDQIVGTEGILRIPSWWMHKILSDLVKYCEENEGASVTIKEYIESQLNLIGKTIEDLGTRLENIESHELFEIVSELPSKPKDNTIYLIPSQNGEGNNVLTEWVHINGTWEQFGEFKADIDLSEYAKKEELAIIQGDAENSAVLKGGNNIAGIFATALGEHTTAKGFSSHAEGINTIAGYDGDWYVPDAADNIAGAYSHAEGNACVAKGSASHAEGKQTFAANTAAHAEGENNTVWGVASHIEGRSNSSTGNYNHVEGYHNNAQNDAEHASGKYNKSVKSTDPAQATSFSHGVGTSESDRRNAFEVKQNGDVYVKGIGGYDGTNPTESSDLATVLANSGATPDWNALEGEEGYIKNKTHYVFWLPYVEFSKDSPISANSYKYLGYNENLYIIPDLLEGERFYISSGPPVYIECKTNERNQLMYFLIDDYNYFLKPLKVAYGVRFLSEAFIPDTIARKTYVDEAIAAAITSTLNTEV